MTGAAAVAVLAALVGTTGIAIGTVLQQRATQRTGEPASTRLLIARVLRDRGWLAGQGVVAVGFLAYAYALWVGPVALVQPILVTALVIGTVTSARLAGRRLDRRLLIASMVCVAGLAAFLAIARPQAPAEPTGPAIVPLLVVAGLAAVVGGLGLRRGTGSDTVRAALLATATGAFYGVTATLFAATLGALGTPLDLAFAATAAGAVVAAVVGWALSQRALHLGRLMAPVTAVICTVDPAVAVLLGVLVLGESVATEPLALLGQGVAAAVVVAGTVVITRQAASVLRVHTSGGSTVAWG